MAVIENFLLQSLQPVALYDRNVGKMIDCNQKLVKLFGYKNKKFFLTIPLVNYLHSEQFDDLTPEQLIAKILDHFNTQEVYMTSIVGLRKNGSIVILEMCVLRNYVGKRNYTVFFFREIDEKYLAHRAILEKTLIYKAIIKDAFDFIDIHEIIITDIEKLKYEGVLIDRSNSMKSALRIGNDVLISPKAMAQVTPPDFLKKNKEAIPSIIRQLVEFNKTEFDWAFQTENNQQIFMNVKANLVFVKDKVILVRIMRDISAKLKRELLIQEQNKELKLKNEHLEAYIESNLQLENFAYVASHDIKAPLRTIHSFANVLFKQISQTLSESEKELLEFIIKGSNDLSILVDDLLNFSKFSNKKIVCDIISTKSFLNDIIARLSILLKEKNVTIQIEDLPEAFIGDRVKIARVFQNLIQNSIKFSKKSEPVHISIEGDEDAKFWYFSIEDNGIGIKKEFQKAIFMMFRKLNGYHYTGSGMGLALSKKIVEQHKGQITVNSTYGKGAKFIFSISKHEL